MLDSNLRVGWNFIASWNQMLSNFVPNPEWFQFKSAKLTRPEWYTKGGEVVWSDGKTNLIEFRPGPNAVLIVPPEAGHTSHIADFGPGQSIVESALKHHPGGVYCLDKLPAKLKHKNLGLDYVLGSLGEACYQIEGPVHLVGLCQGGWKAAAVAANLGDKVKSLTIAGSPIDAVNHDSIITQFCSVIPQITLETMVFWNQGVMPGAYLLSGFLMANSFNTILGELDLLDQLSDKKKLERRRRFEAWYYYTQPQPGRQYLETVDKLFRKNLLFTSTDIADLSHIKCPANLIGGEGDNITRPEQVFALKNLVPHSKEILIPGGHIGIFMSSKSIKNTWNPLFSGGLCNVS